MRLLLALALLPACSPSDDSPKETADPAHDPSIGAVSIAADTGTPTVGATLTCTVTADDDDGDELTTDFTWSIDGTPAGAGPTLALLAGNVGVGSVVTCAATVTDPSGGTAVGSAEVTVGNLAPQLTTPVLSPEVEVYNDGTLGCSATGTDPEGEDLVLTYTWTDASQGLVLGTEPTLALDPAQIRPDDTLTCTVVATDPHGASAAGEASLIVANRAPLPGTLSLTPALPVSTDTLLCELSGVVDPDADPTTVTYRWQLGGVDIADGSSLPGPHAVGDAWTCVATVIDEHTGGVTQQAASVTIQNTAPVVVDLLLDVGTNVNDATLSCAGVASDVDGETPSVSVVWTNDTRGTVLGTSGTVTLDASVASPWEVLSCTVTAVDAHGLSATRTASTTLDNRAPVPGAVQLTPSTPRTTDTLACTLDAATDADGDPVTTTLVWTVDGARAGVGPTLPAGTRRGAVVRCTATLADGHGGTSDAWTEVTLADSAPVLTGLVLAPEAPTTMDTLSASVSGTDADADAVALTWTWTVDGVEVQSGPESTLPARTARRGQVVSVTVTGTDATLTSAPLTADVTIENAAPVARALALTPSVVRTDDLLTAGAVLSDEDGDTVRLRYDWYVDDTLVQSGTSAALDGRRTFGRDDRVHVDLYLDDGTSVVLGATAGVTVANTPPTAPVAALDSAAPVEGEPVVCNVDRESTDADADDITYAFTWAVDGVSVPTASTASTYERGDTIPADLTLEGETWTCTITPSDDTEAGPSATTSARIDSAACRVTVTVDTTEYGPYDLDSAFTGGNVYAYTSATSYGIESSGARWDDFEARDADGNVIASSAFDSTAGWSWASGGICGVAFSGGVATSSSDWAVLSYTAGAFDASEALTTSYRTYWDSRTDGFYQTWASASGHRASGCGGYGGGVGTTYLHVALTHNRYHVGSGPDTLEISALSSTGTQALQVRDTTVAVPAAGSGWHTFDVTFEGCGG